MHTMYVRDFNAPPKNDTKCLALQTFKEVDTRGIDGNAFIRGFYMNFENGFTGIVGTKDGPMYFWREKFYLLRKGNFSFGLENKGIKQRFTFEWKNMYQHSVMYSYSIGKNRLSNDFFYWLAQAALQDKFFRFYAPRASQKYEQIIESLSVDYKKVYT